LDAELGELSTANAGLPAPPAVRPPRDPRTVREIPLYTADVITRGGFANARAHVLSVPGVLDLSAQAYAVRYEAGLSAP